MAGQTELEAIAARHYRDRVLGLGARIPLGGALARADLAATRLRDGGWKLSGLLNLDYSLVVLKRNAYLFAEYYHNGFGAGRMPETYLGLKPALRERLLRGETFNLMRDYLALGANIEWHPLWQQSLSLIGNLQDGSALLQTSLTFEPGDRQRLQLGWTEPLGGAGQEFGGAPCSARRPPLAAPAPCSPAGPAISEPAIFELGSRSRRSLANFQARSPARLAVSSRSPCQACYSQASGRGASSSLTRLPSFPRACASFRSKSYRMTFADTESAPLVSTPASARTKASSSS